MRAAFISLALIASPLAAVPPTLVQGQAKFGQEIRLGSYRVRPLKVIEDSRCPLRKECEWAGRIIVRTEVKRSSLRQVYDFELGGGRQKPRGRGLKLIAATPHPIDDETIAPSAYRFTFRFDPEA